MLSRPGQVAVHHSSPEEIDHFLINFASFTDLTRIHSRYRPLLHDANDEMVLEAAINGRAQVIATHNVKHFPAASQFGIEICTPGRILTEWK